MRKQLSAIIDFLIHTNLFIASAAAALTYETVHLFELEIHSPWIYVLVFFATLSEYNLHRLLTLLNSKEALLMDKHQWLRENKRFFYALMVFSLLGLAFALFFVHTETLKGLAPLGLLTLLYTIPFIRYKKRVYKLRDIPVFKTLVIALIWSISTLILPFREAHQEFSEYLMLLERTLFVFAICIPFDVRDMEADRSSGLKTLPLLVGEDKSVNIAVALMYLCTPFIFIQFIPMSQIGAMIGLLINTALVIYFLKSRKWRYTKHYHYGILDGTMISHAVLAVIGNILYP